MATISVAQLVVIMNNAIVNIALPELSVELAVPERYQSWAVTSYLLAFGSLLLIGGRITDRIGHRRAFIGGLIGTAVFASLAGAAPTAWVYFLARGLQGAVAAVLAPAALALLSTTFSGASRARAFGVYGAVTGVGAAVGMLAGGLLTDLLSWRATMFVSVPTVLIAALAARRTLTADRETTSSAWHVPSVLSAFSGVALLLVGLAQVEGDSAGTGMAVIAVGGLVIAGFAALQYRTPDALVPPALVCDRRRLLGVIVLGVGGLGMTGLFVIVSLYVQRVLGMSALSAALVCLPYPVGLAVSSNLSPALISRFGEARVAGWGLLSTGVCLLPLGFTGPDGSSLILVIAALAGTSVTMGPAFVAATRLAMSQVPRGQAGSMGAVMNSSGELGGAIGVPLLVLVATATATDGRPGYGSAMVGAGVIVSAGAVVVLGGRRCSTVDR
ncbi:MFS transporter [Tsukamurella serpentis]